jgi:hypothetical protein
MRGRARAVAAAVTGTVSIRFSQAVEDAQMRTAVLSSARVLKVFAPQGDVTRQTVYSEDPRGVVGMLPPAKSGAIVVATIGIGPSTAIAGGWTVK